MTDVIVWTVGRWVDFVGAVLVGVLWLRKTKRRVETLMHTEEERQRDRRDIEARLALGTYVIGTGLLFGRAAIVGNPGGIHLLLILLPIVWALKPLIASEITHQRNRRKNR